MFHRNDNDYPHCKISMTDNSYWFYYINVKLYEPNVHGRYKLHISIDPHEFNDIHQEIHHLLHKALQKGLIISYKTCNVELALKITSTASAVDKKRIKYEDDLRQLNAPFIIYLNADLTKNYLNELAELCDDIEKILSNIKPGDINKRSRYDLPLTQHIIFRQAYLNSTDLSRKNYIYAIDHKTNYQLLSESKNSIAYQALLSAVKTADLKTVFTKEVNLLMQILNDYKTQLQIELTRLNEEYGPLDRKVIIITEKIQQIEDELTIIKDGEKKYIDTEYKNMETAKADFNDFIKYFNKVTIETVQFDSEKRKELTAMVGWKHKKKVMNFFIMTTSTTERNLNQIDENIRKELSLCVDQYFKLPEANSPSP